MIDDDFDDSSAPCFAHKLVDGHLVDPATLKDVTRFRKSERTRLYAKRKALPLDERNTMAATIAAALNEQMPSVSGITIAVYWPIKGELDLRDWMAEAHARGATIALPVVIEKNAAVAFHKWTPDCTMRAGFWNIPVPESAEPVVPDIVIVPLLGVDEERFRLGNGGGYYDHTLAALPDSVMAIGVGQPFAKMKTIFPMPWDIPMHKIILGDGTCY